MKTPETPSSVELMTLSVDTAHELRQDVLAFGYGELYMNAHRRMRSDNQWLQNLAHTVERSLNVVQLLGANPSDLWYDDTPGKLFFGGAVLAHEAYRRETALQPHASRGTLRQTIAALVEQKNPEKYDVGKLYRSGIVFGKSDPVLMGALGAVLHEDETTRMELQTFPENNQFVLSGAGVVRYALSLARTRGMSGVEDEFAQDHLLQLEEEYGEDLEGVFAGIEPVFFNPQNWN